MNDKDRDLIQQVLSAAGTAGEKGFSYLVHFQFVSGLVSSFGFGVLLLGSLWAIRRLLTWSPEEDEAHIARAVALVGCCAIFVGFVFGFFEGITAMLAPEGAAIHDVVHH